MIHSRSAGLDSKLFPELVNSDVLLNEPGKTQDIRSLRRVFDGIVAIDGKEHHLIGRGNGPISSLANALHAVGVELDVQDYKEHAVGRGREVKAATYIECTANGTEQRVWGVGIHEDAVASSLYAVLSAASNVRNPRRSYERDEQSLLIRIVNSSP